MNKAIKILVAVDQLLQRLAGEVGEFSEQSVPEIHRHRLGLLKLHASLLKQQRADAQEDYNDARS